MKKSIFKIILTLLLVLILGCSATPLNTYAATKTTTADQKTIAKKFYKKLKKEYKNNVRWNKSVKYKKTGNRYTYTVTMTSIQMDLDYIRGAAFVGGDNYGAMLKALVKNNKEDYRDAKKSGLKKPIVYLVWMSSDGYKVATFKNGSMR